MAMTPASSELPPPDIDRAYVVTAATIVSTAIALLLTALRIYVRRWLVKFFDWDDLFNVLGMACMIVVLGLVLTATQHGLGRHFIYVDKERASYGIMLLRISEFMLILTTVFVKISISLFLMKLFVRSKTWKIFLWAFITFNTVTSVLDAVLIFPQCTPVEFNWNKAIEGHCWSNGAINGIGIMQGSIAALTDFVLSVLPTLFLWNIKILLRVKIGICAIMALGFASGAFAIARTVLVPSLTATHDPTWDLIPLFMWAVLESNFGVIAAAAPSVRPLLGGLSGSTTNSKPLYHSQPFSNSNPRSNTRPRSSWYGGSAGYNVRGVHLKDEEDFSEGGDQVEMLPRDGKSIVRTTEIQVA
ncbi:MAG: hypothetical protein M1821_002462 [Bathelium mastoideum]|nr:MAG: hypothetical protein M1821_002462 [Bathelium mastoideum]